MLLHQVKAMVRVAFLLGRRVEFPRYALPVCSARRVVPAIKHFERGFEAGKCIAVALECMAAAPVAHLL